MRHIVASLLLPFLILVLHAGARSQHAFEVLLPGIEPASDGSIVQTPDGGFCLLFRYATYAINESGYEYLDDSYLGLAKLSADGILEWSRYAVIEDMDLYPIALREHPDGGFVALGATYNWDEKAGDIVVARFNAHGYPLWTKSYDAGEIDLVRDCLVFDEGDVLILGSARKSDSENALFYPTIVHIGPEGELLKSYLLDGLPSSLDDDYLDMKITPRNFGTITITGTASDMEGEDYFGFCCTLTRDGIVGGAMHIDPMRGRQSKDRTSVTDAIPTDNGGCVLLGYSSLSDCSWDGSYGFALALDSGDNVLWTRHYHSNEDPLPLVTLIPRGESDVAIIARYFHSSYDESGGYTYYNDHLIGEIDSAGVMTRATLYSPAMEMVGKGFQYSSCIPTDDEGLAIVQEVEDDDYARLGIFVNRLNPDYTSCNDIVRRIRSDNTLTSSDADIYFADVPDDPVRGFNKGEENIRSGSEEDQSEDAIGYEDPVKENEGKMEEGEDDDARDETVPALPWIERITVTTSDMDVAVKSHHIARVEELYIDAQVLCRGNQLPQSASLSTTRENEAGLRLSPNIARVGENIAMDFKLANESAAPEIALLTVATGQVVRRIEPTAIRWSSATGHGNAVLFTEGLARGVYLVRVRSGEEVLTAKLEMQ